MSGIAQKLNMGVAAAALAAAATLTPVAVANADSPAPISALGSQIGSAQCTPTKAEPCAPAAADAVQAADTPGSTVRSIFQNDLWWIGQANPNPPARSTVLEFTPINLVPGFLRPLYGWFTQNLNFEACLFGGSVKVGPYGTTTVSVGRGCN